MHNETNACDARTVMSEYRGDTGSLLIVGIDETLRHAELVFQQHVVHVREEHLL